MQKPWWLMETGAGLLDWLAPLRCDETGKVAVRAVGTREPVRHLQRLAG